MKIVFILDGAKRAEASVRRSLCSAIVGNAYQRDRTWTV